MEEDNGDAAPKSTAGGEVKKPSLYREQALEARNQETYCLDPGLGYSGTAFSSKRGDNAPTRRRWSIGTHATVQFARVTVYIPSPTGHSSTGYPAANPDLFTTGTGILQAGTSGRGTAQLGNITTSRDGPRPPPLPIAPLVGGGPAQMASNLPSGPSNP